MNGVNIKKRVSCGCQQHNSTEWKSRGAKTMPWRLPPGEAAKNNVEHSYKRCAKKRNLEYSLTRNQFETLVLGTCFYCGRLKQNIKRGQGKTSGDSAYNGIDRVNPILGYTPDNCVSCCWKCNNMKGTLESAEFFDHITSILKYTKKRSKS